MQCGVSIKEYSKNGKRYIKVNDSVCEIDDRYDTGYLLYLLLQSQLILKRFGLDVAY